MDDEHDDLDMLAPAADDSDLGAFGVAADLPDDTFEDLY